MEHRVTVRVVLKNQNGVNVVCAESIKFTDDEATFSFPTEFQSSTHHTELFNLSVMKNAAKSLTRVGHYRNIKLVLKEPLVKTYVDEAENFIFGESVLEELTISSNLYEEPDTNISSELLNILRKVTTEDRKWDDIDKRFSLEKFSGREKATEWLTSFENECKRHGLDDDSKKIKCLKLFLTDNALDWYKSNAMKIKDENWSTWAESFLKVYADKGWAKVRHAYNYRYLAGSFIDYALKKERLILEVESRMPHCPMINQIVIGLPIPIQDKLDREELRTTDDLMNRLRQFESSSTKKLAKTEKSSNTSESARPKSEQQQHDRSTGKFVDKKPCSICESKGYSGRFHPIERCRNRNRRSDESRINLNEETDHETSESLEEKN